MHIKPLIILQRFADTLTFATRQVNIPPLLCLAKAFSKHDLILLLVDVSPLFLR